MLAGVARVGDNVYVHCLIHGWRSGTITAGSTLTKIEGIAIARVGDAVMANCGHYGVIKTGSTVLTDDGKAVARNGDAIENSPFGVIAEGIITSGSDWVLSD